MSIKQEDIAYLKANRALIDTDMIELLGILGVEI